MNERQKAFADYYIECGNATEAAKRAGYSEKTAYSIGQRLLKNVEVSAYVEKRMTEQEAARVASADEVLQFFTRVMRGEEKDAFGLDAALDTRMNAGRELLKRHAAGGVSREKRPDDGLKAALAAAAGRLCAGEDDSAMLPEGNDGNENG